MRYRCNKCNKLIRERDTIMSVVAIDGCITPHCKKCDKEIHNFVTPLRELLKKMKG